MKIRFCSINSNPISVVTALWHFPFPFSFFQCNVAAAMVASASVSYSSVNQYDGNRSIMWRHLNTCSTCDKNITTTNISGNSASSSTGIRQNRTCRHAHHYHHNRRPAIRQNKRCTFATATTTIPVSSTIGCSQALSSGNGRRHHSQQQQQSFDGKDCGVDSADCNQKPHQQCQSQSSNSSNTSSIRIID